MYIDYSKLWKLLIDKHLSKTDLMELTGLSSRIIAKLSKNETVTTETVAKICAALFCDVGDVMECLPEKAMSLYDSFRRFGKIVNEGEQVKKYCFSVNGQKYTVYMTTQTATKATQICCEDDATVYWEQHYMMGGMCTPSIVKKVLIKPIREADEIVLVVIKGKPGIIIGLDEGMWVSAKKGRLNTDQDVFVMSETAFKLFEIKNSASFS